MNLAYLLPRLVRHFLPERLARFLLQRGWIIKPGLETTDPHMASERYFEAIRDAQSSLAGSRVLVLGYGGSYAVAVDLLSRGAAHVVLAEHVVMPDQRRNSNLLPRYEKYLVADRGGVHPRPEFITLLHGDIRLATVRPADLVLSTSVYEHLQDVRGVTRALALLTVPTGLHIHYVDLRDHFFRYPFEMLCFSETIWRRFLNPSSNLNRFRILDYQHAFSDQFEHLEVRVLAREPEAFAAVRRRIRPEFLSGDEAADSATLIQIVAMGPRILASSGVA